MVLKSSICTSASPRRQRSHWGLRVTQDVNFLLLRHTKQLLFVKFFDKPAGIDKNYDPWKYRQTDVKSEVVVIHMSPFELLM